MKTLLSQLPTLSPGQLETWLLSALAVAAAVALGIKLFVRRPSLEAEFVTKDEFRQFRASVEADLSGLRDRIDTRHVAVVQTLEQVKGTILADGERRSAELHVRLSHLEAGLARVDERTKGTQ